MTTADRLSRYTSVPGVTAPDPQGRVLPGTEFRPLPDVTGPLRHTVGQGDRIDRLAAGYYGRPLIWWTICDANPDFLSPFELLGNDPVVTTQLPLAPNPLGAGRVPPWPELVDALHALPGVESVLVRDDVALDPQRRDGTGGRTVTVWVPRPLRAAVVRHNELTTPAELLAGTARGLGWLVGPPVRLDRLGREIVVPPVGVGRR
jgi:hypothetical protein